MGDTHVGLQARLMCQALRKLAGTLNRTDTICLFTNQLREKIGVMFGNPETTPGGRALKFYSSVRLDIRRIETLKDGVEAIGNRVRVKVVKNKVAPPFKQAEFDIIYGGGISWEGTVLDAGLERKVVQKSGSYFSFGEERLGQGRHNATAFLREHPDVTQADPRGDPDAGRRRPGRVREAAARRPTPADADEGARRGCRSESVSTRLVELAARAYGPPTARAPRLDARLERQGIGEAERRARRSTRSNGWATSTTNERAALRAERLADTRLRRRRTFARIWSERGAPPIGRARSRALEPEPERASRSRAAAPDGSRAAASTSRRRGLAFAEAP